MNKLYGEDWLLERNRRYDTGRMLGWSNDEIKAYWRGFRNPENYVLPYTRTDNV